MKPTGKKLTFIGVDIDKVIDGKIVEHGGAVNTFETLFQEGLIRLKDRTNVAEAFGNKTAEIPQVLDDGLRNL